MAASKSEKRAKASKPEHIVSQAEVQPWHRLGGIEHICELRKSASVLYSIFVTILRSIYADKKGRTFACPCVVWSQDAAKTQIWIDTELRWEDQRPDFTPAIYVNLGQIQYEVDPSLDMQGRTYMSPQGEQHYERMGKGMASFMHVCDTTGEAVALADNTENYLSSLQDQIAEQFCFNHFTVVGRQPLNKKDGQQTAGKDKLVSIVTVSFDFVDAWKVKFETPILKAINMVEQEHRDVEVSGSTVDVVNGEAIIEFGDMSSETGTPVDA